MSEDQAVTPLQRSITQMLHPTTPAPRTLTSLHLTTPVLTPQEKLELEAFREVPLEKKGP
jgi:hypothetical protein